MSAPLVAVPEAVPIAVHADAFSGTGRHAGVRHGAVRGERPQRRVGDGRLSAPIFREQARSHVEEAGFVVVDPGFGDEIALPRIRPLAQEVDAVAHRRGARGRERDLLAHGGCQVGGECQDERLELPPLELTLRPLRNAVAAGPVENLREADPMDEAEHRIQATVVEEPVAAHLISLETVVAAEEPGVLGIPELSNLLIEVAQMGSLEELWIEVEAPAAVRAEEPGSRGVRIGVRVDRVATGAGEDDAIELRSRRDPAVDGVEELAPGLLNRG